MSPLCNLCTFGQNDTCMHLLSGYKYKHIKNLRTYPHDEPIHTLATTILAHPSCETTPFHQNYFIKHFWSVVSHERTLWYTVISWNRASPNLAATMVVTRLFKEIDRASLRLDYGTQIMKLEICDEISKINCNPKVIWHMRGEWLPSSHVPS